MISHKLPHMPYIRGTTCPTQGNHVPYIEEHFQEGCSSKQPCCHMSLNHSIQHYHTPPLMNNSTTNPNTVQFLHQSLQIRGQTYLKAYHYSLVSTWLLSCAHVVQQQPLVIYPLICSLVGDVLPSITCAIVLICKHSTDHTHTQLLQSIPITFNWLSAKNHKLNQWRAGCEPSHACLRGVHMSVEGHSFQMAFHLLAEQPFFFFNILEHTPLPT